MRYLYLTVLLTGLLACKKDYEPLYEYEDLTNTANVKFVHALSNLFADPANPSDSVQLSLQVYSNGQKLTGNNVAYRGVFPNLEYAKVPAGNFSFKWMQSKTATSPEKLIVETPFQLKADQTYTLFLMDTLPQPKVLAVEEDLKTPVADSGNFFVRLINLTSQSPGYDLLDSVAKTNTAPGYTTTLFTNINYSSVSSFIQFNVGTAAKKFVLRNSGSTSNLITLDFTPVAGRMYTIFTSGVAGADKGRKLRMTLMTTRFQTMNY